MANPLTNPYTTSIFSRPIRRSADILAKRAAALPLTASTMTLSSFVPTDQQAKLAMIADAANLLASTLSNRSPPANVTPADLRLASGTAATQLDLAAAKLPPGSVLGQIAADLKALQAAPDATLISANTALTRFLPQQIDRLRLALMAQPVTLASIPPEIARDWQLSDGRTRVQVTPKPAANGSQGLNAFVDQVTQAIPGAGGAAVSIIATSRTIIGAFQNAAIGAIVMIALILFLVLRRPLDVALVLAPLLMSALLTVLLCVTLPLPLNFANVIALPLLLGVGVSFNIYFVMNWRAGEHSRLASATAPGGGVLGADHEHGIWLAGPVAPSGHGEHGGTSAA